MSKKKKLRKKGCWCCGKIGGYNCFYCSPVRLPKKGRKNKIAG